MVASSVTGVGPGDSHGMQKPELHTGCCGGSSGAQNANSSPPRKRGCHIKYSGGSGSLPHNFGTGGVKSTSCF